MTTISFRTYNCYRITLHMCIFIKYISTDYLPDTAVCVLVRAVVWWTLVLFGFLGTTTHVHMHHQRSPVILINVRNAMPSSRQNLTSKHTWINTTGFVLFVLILSLLNCMRNRYFSCFRSWFNFVGHSDVAVRTLDSHLKGPGFKSSRWSLGNFIHSTSPL